MVSSKPAASAKALHSNSATSIHVVSEHFGILYLGGLLGAAMFFLLCASFSAPLLDHIQSVLSCVTWFVLLNILVSPDEDLLGGAAVIWPGGKGSDLPRECDLLSTGGSVLCRNA